MFYVPFVRGAFCHLFNNKRILHCKRHNDVTMTLLKQQELSYRKQIARQLRTQYVEGIYDNPVTLKARLRITQGPWKQNHWVDHTRLTISRVI